REAAIAGGAPAARRSPPGTSALAPAGSTLAALTSRGGRRHTRRVALVALAFHGNFSYVWLRALERALPGRRPPAVLAKVLCDQLLGAPVAVLAFYTGECGAARPLAAAAGLGRWGARGESHLFASVSKARTEATCRAQYKGPV
uniref:Mpv17-like protein n=1 Tax=Dromaius novaehollandiae TaxID=8790 RepID=A0A8C4KKR0_DRONO